MQACCSDIKLQNKTSQIAVDRVYENEPQHLHGFLSDLKNAKAYSAHVYEQRHVFDQSHAHRRRVVQFNMEDRGGMELTLPSKSSFDLAKS